MSRSPNILLILADQLRHDATRPTGGRHMRTPSLDRLASGGTVYEQAWTPSPVCVPARASLLYGQYPWQTGCMGNGDPMPTDRPSFADSLAAAGYRTHVIGKCHFTPDPQAARGFAGRERQEEIVQEPQDDEYLQWLAATGYAHIRDPQGSRSAMVYMPQVSTLPEHAHPTRWVGDRACAFIESAAESVNKQPWLLMASFIHPHPPYSPPSPWDKLYWPHDMPAPHLPPGYSALRPPQADRELYHYHLDGPQNPVLWQQIRASYAACVSFVDQQVGRILDALDSQGLADDTLVVFTADHGDMLGDYDLVGKGCMFDASARVPMIVRWPDGSGAGARCETPVSLVDLAPTFLRAAGVTPPTHYDGQALQTLPDDPSRVVYSQIRAADMATWMAVDGRGKYIYRAESDQELCFDRDTDPGETRDAGPTAWGDRLKTSLRRRLQHDAPDVLDGADWRRYPPRDPARAQRNRGDNPWADYRIDGYSD